MSFPINDEFKGKRDVINPEVFAEEMREISENGDTEGRHIDADRLMCKVLEKLGYSEGVETFKNMEKWYA